MVELVGELIVLLIVRVGELDVRVGELEDGLVGEFDDGLTGALVGVTGDLIGVTGLGEITDLRGVNADWMTGGLAELGLGDNDLTNGIRDVVDDGEMDRGESEIEGRLANELDFKSERLFAKLPGLLDETETEACLECVGVLRLLTALLTVVLRADIPESIFAATFVFLTACLID